MTACNRLVSHLMDGMAIQIEHSSSRPFDICGSWHYRDHTYQEAGLCKALPMTFHNFQTPLLPNNLETDRNCRSSNECEAHHANDPDLSRHSAKPDPKRDRPPATNRESYHLKGSEKTPTCYKVRPVSTKGLSCKSRLLQDRLSEAQRPLKRRRAVTDVDGPNTADLGSKKRRLRAQRVTSRLSRPFSWPATHTIIRDTTITSVTDGSRSPPMKPYGRFRSLAAVIARNTKRKPTSILAEMTPATLLASLSQSGQLHNHSPSTFLRRIAAVNHFRTRMRDTEVLRGNDETRHATGHRHLVEHPSPHLLPSMPYGNTASSSIIYRTSAVQKELVKLEDAQHEFEEEHLDPDEIAFPTSEHESRYAEDEEDQDAEDGVYADFAAIFGNKGAGDDEEDGCNERALEAEIEREADMIEREVKVMDQEPRLYEGGLDKLDGIPKMAR